MFLITRVPLNLRGQFKGIKLAVIFMLWCQKKKCKSTLIHNLITVIVLIRNEKI